MYNDYLDTQILLENETINVLPGATISGKIIFTPKIDLYVQELGYQLLIVIKNQFVKDDFPVQKNILFRNKRILKDKAYSYDIEFKADMLASFQFNKLQIECFIQGIVNLQTSSYLKVRNDYIAKNQGSRMLETNGLLWSKKKIEITYSELNYSVKEQSFIAENNYHRPWIYFAIGLILILSLVLFFDLTFKSQILGSVIGVMFLIFIVPQIYKETILNTIEIDVKQLENNQFGIFLNLTKNWKRIRSVKVEYAAFGENFTQDESELTQTLDLYLSPPVEKSKIQMPKDNILDFPEITYDFILDYPSRYIPPTFKSYPIKFYWEFKVTVFFIFGIKSEYVKEIIVSQKPTSLLK